MITDICNVWLITFFHVIGSHSKWGKRHPHRTKKVTTLFAEQLPLSQIVKIVSHFQSICSDSRARVLKMNKKGAVVISIMLHNRGAVNVQASIPTANEKTAAVISHYASQQRSSQCSGQHSYSKREDSSCYFPLCFTTEEQSMFRPAFLQQTRRQQLLFPIMLHNRGAVNVQASIPTANEKTAAVISHYASQQRSSQCSGQHSYSKREDSSCYFPLCFTTEEQSVFPLHFTTEEQSVFPLHFTTQEQSVFPLHFTTQEQSVFPLHFTTQEQSVFSLCFTRDVNTFLTKYLQLSYLPSIKYFGLPVSVSCPVYSKVDGEESSFGIGLKGMYISFMNLEWRSHEPKGNTSLLWI